MPDWADLCNLIYLRIFVSASASHQDELHAYQKNSITDTTISSKLSVEERVEFKQVNSQRWLYFVGDLCLVAKLCTVCLTVCIKYERCKHTKTSFPLHFRIGSKSETICKSFSHDNIQRKPVL